MITTAKQYLKRVQEKKPVREKQVVDLFIRDLDNAVDGGYTGFIFPSWTKNSEKVLREVALGRYPFLKIYKEYERGLPTIRIEVREESV